MLPTRPIILATFGLPGSGKTYFAEKLAHDWGLVHLNTDIIRGRLFPCPVYSDTESAIVFREMDRLALRHLLAGRGIIYDGNLSKIEHRASLKHLAELLRVPLLFVAFQTEAEISLTRLAQRRAEYTWPGRLAYPPVGSDIYLLMRERLEPLTPDERAVWFPATLDYSAQLASLQRLLLEQRDEKRVVSNY